MKYELGFYFNPHGAQRCDIMKGLADAGIKYAGIDGCGWEPDGESQEIEEFRNEMAEHGLSLHAMHACCSILATPDKDTPPELLEEQLKEIRRGALFGVKTAVYHACWMRDVDFRKIDQALENIPWDSFVEKNAKTIKILAHEAAKSGISIVLENINLSVRSESFAGFADIIEAVDEQNVGFILDSGHAHISDSKLSDEISFAGKKLMDTHFHDNIGPATGELSDDQHLPPGLGTIDWQETIKTLNAIKFPGPVMFEGVLGPSDNLLNGPFHGELDYSDIIRMTINNWRALELLALR